MQPYAYSDSFPYCVTVADKDCKNITDLGRQAGVPHFSMQNLLGPLEPLRAAKPSYGTDDVPVTN